MRRKRQRERERERERDGPLILQVPLHFPSVRIRVVLRRDVSRVVDGGAEAHGVLASEQTEQQPDDVAGQWAVRVGPAQVDDRDELREQDDVDQVAAQVPQLVDGVDHDAHHHRQHADAEYSEPHHPDDLPFRSLESGNNSTDVISATSSSATWHDAVKMLSGNVTF